MGGDDPKVATAVEGAAWARTWIAFRTAEDEDNIALKIEARIKLNELALIALNAEQRAIEATVPSNKVDVNAHGVNLYGCQPCPKCEGKFRYLHNGTVVCPDCNHVEQVAADA